MEPEMSKAEFVKLLTDPDAKAPGIGDRFSWVDLLKELNDHDEPFTVAQITEESGQPSRYVYSHLRDWVKDGKLVKINAGGKNFYMAAAQVAGED